MWEENPKELLQEKHTQTDRDSNPDLHSAPSGVQKGVLEVEERTWTTPQERKNVVWKY